MNKKINNFNKIKKDIKDILKPSKFDPFGSYSGLTKDDEEPIQDQDDL